jgi:hypothetical protein
LLLIILLIKATISVGHKKKGRKTTNHTHHSSEDCELHLPTQEQGLVLFFSQERPLSLLIIQCHSELVEVIMEYNTPTN